MALWAGGVAAGQSVDGAIVTPSAHCFTPQSSGRTHYFYSISFPRSMGPMAEDLALQNVVILRGPFEHEDKPVLEAVGRNMGGKDLFALKPVLLPGDAAAVRARRLLQAMIDKEAAE